MEPYRFVALSPLCVSPDGINFYEMPEGADPEEFLKEQAP